MCGCRSTLEREEEEEEREKKFLTKKKMDREGGTLSYHTGSSNLLTPP